MFHEVLVFHWLFHTQFTLCTGTIGGTIVADNPALLSKYRESFSYSQ